MNNDYSYGVLVYNSVNIGDEIQSIAAMRFLPKIDEYVYRELISHFYPETGRKTKCILNAWWMWNCKHFPPSKFIEPLLIAMYVRPNIRKEFLTKKVKEYLTKFGPVGCRDVATYKWLESENIPSYFSGCLTLTLKRNENIMRDNYILCVDTSEELIQSIKKRTNRPVIAISRMISPYYSALQRLEYAKLQLLLYSKAHLVVSSRLHVILPSLALETPVLRIISNEKEMGEISRYSGYENFFNSYTNEQIINGDVYDFENPLKNPSVYLPMRERLIDTCEKFTGYNNPDSLIGKEENALAKFAELNKYNYENLRKCLYCGSKKDLKYVLKHSKKPKLRHGTASEFKLEPELSYFSIYGMYYLYLLLSKFYKKEHYSNKLKKINKYKELLSEKSPPP